MAVSLHHSLNARIAHGSLCHLLQGYKGKGALPPRRPRLVKIKTVFCIPLPLHANSGPLLP